MTTVIKLMLLISGISSSLLALDKPIAQEFITVEYYEAYRAQGSFEVEKGTTLLQLIYFTGGLTFCDEVKIQISDEPQTRIVEVDVGDLCDADREDIELQSGWRIMVPEHVLPCTDPEIINPKIKDYIERHYPHFRVIRRMEDKTIGAN